MGCCEVEPHPHLKRPVRGTVREIIKASGLTTTALSTQEVDYTTNGSALLTGVLKGMGMRVVMGISNRNLFSLVAAPEISSPRDLRDRVIGVASFGGTQHLTTESYLTKIGFEPGKNVRLLAVGDPSSRMAALEKRLIHATLLPPPGNVFAEKKGYRILVRGEEMSNVPHALFGTHLGKLAKDRQEVVGVITTLLRGLRFIHQEPEEAVRLFSEWGNLEMADARRVYDLTIGGYPEDGRLDEGGIQTLAQMIQKAGGIASGAGMSVRDFIDLISLKEAVTRIGRR
jgi:ABC-type nitrate/sulfonate/bicarbonate transport system substrate-binding protein